VGVLIGDEKDKESTMKTRGTFSLMMAACLLGSSAATACTSFVLENNGYAVFGANLDFRIHEGLMFVNKRNVNKTGLDPGSTGEYARWTSRYGSLTFNLVGYEFAWAGMNEAGLVISTMFLETTENPAPDARPPLEPGVWLQYQLDNWSSIEEVIASDTVVRMAPGNNEHYLVSDRTGSSAVVEFIDGKIIVHTGESLPVQALTNNTYEESVREWEKSRWWMFWRFLEKKFWKSSLIRFEIAADRVKDFDEDGKGSAVQYAFDTLQEACDDAPSNPTQWSIVFDTENLKIYFRTRANPRIRTISFSSLDFSCSTPVRMLDIHHNPSGDIVNDFIDYSHEVSLNHFLRFFEKWGKLDISPEETRQLAKHMESFRCDELGE